MNNGDDWDNKAYDCVDDGGYEDEDTNGVGVNGIERIAGEENHVHNIYLPF